MPGPMHWLQARSDWDEVLRQEYLPAARNSIVRDLYSMLGFEKTGSYADGTSRWLLRVDSYTKKENKTLSKAAP